jgi:hypothetical protein
LREKRVSLIMRHASCPADRPADRRLARQVAAAGIGGITALTTTIKL